MLDEKRKEGLVRRALEEEVDGLSKQVKELELQVKSLQDASASSKEARVKREAAVSESGAKDCVKSAYRFFLEND